MSARAKPDQIMIFLHIPKAGGSTLHRIIERQYTIDESITMNGSIRQMLDEFYGLPRNAQDQIKVVKGHTPFGLHGFLSRPSTYITILRDPIDRLISYYCYVLRSPDNEHHEIVMSQSMGLRDYLTSGLIRDISQTRWVSGVAKAADVKRCTREHLEIAKRLVERRIHQEGPTFRYDASASWFLNRCYGFTISFGRFFLNSG